MMSCDASRVGTSADNVPLVLSDIQDAADDYHLSISDIQVGLTVPPLCESTPVRKEDQSFAKDQNMSRSEEKVNGQKQLPTPNRTRRKTITLHSQLSSDVANAFKNIKNLDNEESFSALQQYIERIILAKEREWFSKTQQMAEELDRMEQKAVERNLLLYESDRVMKMLKELLKTTAHKTNAIRSAKSSLGDPGPERLVSSEEIGLIRRERDQLAEDVISWETSYDELYKRYDKLRQVSLDVRKDADDVKEAYKKLEEQYASLSRNFELLRVEAENELNRANLEMDRLERLRETDTLGLRLKLKHLETKNGALCASLEAKKKEIADMETLFEDIVHKAERNAAEGFS